MAESYRTTSRKIMASKLQYQRNHSARVASAVSHTGKRFLTELRHHHASSSLTGKIDTKVISLARPRVTMKNLCLRRVFSPSSFSTDWDFDVKGKNRTNELNDESPPCKSNVTREGSRDLVDGFVATGDDVEAVELSETTFTGEVSLVKNEAGSLSQEINEVTGKKIRYPEKIFKNPGSVSYRRMLPYLMETADGTKDVDMNEPKNERGELMAAKDRVPESEHVSRSANSFVKPSSAQSLHGNISPSMKLTSSNATKVSLCSRRKLFKVPGSVNYRRMLSYLKENPDNTGMPETSTHIDPQRNIEENALATENKGVSNEARDSNSCPTNFDAPLSDPDNEQETRLKRAEFVSSVAVSVI